MVAVAVVITGSPTAHAAAATAEPLGTLAGRSAAAMYPSGLEYDAAHDRLVVADTGLDRILLYGTDGTRLGEFGTPGGDAGQLASPRDVAVAGDGTIFVADAENNRVQKFAADGTFLGQVGGIGGCGTCLNTPIGVSWDGANDVVIVASTGQSLVKAFHPDLTLAWASPARTVTGLQAPRDAGRAPDGRLWVADYGHHQVKFFAVDPAGSWSATPTLVLGDGVAAGNGDGQLNFPYNVVFSPDGATAYVSDTGNGRVARWAIDGSTATWLPPLGGRCIEHPAPCPDPPGAPGQFNHLRRVAIDGGGTIYAADFWGNGIEVFAPDGSVVDQIEGASAPLPGFAEAFGVDAGPDGSVYVMDRLNHRIQRFGPDGAFAGAAGSRGTQPGTFSWPEAVAVAPDGAVWAVDTRGGRIQRWPGDLATSPPIPSFGAQGAGVGQFNWPAGITVDGAGTVWVADTRNHRIQRFDPGTQTFAAVATPAGALQQPMGVAAAADALYVADTLHDRVVKLALDGTELAAFTAGLSAPEGIALAPDNTLWVADTGNGRVVHLDAGLQDLGHDIAGFDGPHSLTATATRLYVADTYNHRVQRYDVSGSEPVPLAPVWQEHVSEPGGIAPLYPAGAVADGTGGAYVADSGGSRVVHVAGDGAVIPVSSGSDWADPRDLAWDGDGQHLWVVDTGDSEVVKLDLDGAVVATLGGPATLTNPYGIDAASGGVFVADTYNNRVVRLDAVTGAVAWTLATCDGTAFSRPRDVTLGSDGNVYVADTDNDRIAAVDAGSGACLDAFGSRGTGPGQFRSPRSISSDGDEGLWVGDAFNERVQHLALDGSFVAATTAGAAFRQPSCVYLDGPLVGVCDQWSYRIQRFTVDGAGAPHLLDAVGGTPPVPGGFNHPFAAAYGPGGELYAVDWGNHRIQKFGADGTFETEWGGYGTGPGELIFPRAVTVTPDGTTVVVTNSEGNRIDLFTAAGTHSRTIRPAGTTFARLHQTALAADGTYWVADTLNDRVLHLGAAGTVLHEWGAGVLDDPKGIALDAAGRVHVSDSRHDRVLTFAPDGTQLGVLSDDVTDPHLLTIANVSGRELVLIADTGGHRVLAVTPDGEPAGSFGTRGPAAGQLVGPRDVAVSPGGQLAVADHGNDRLSLWSLAGTPPPADTTPPDATVAFPAPNQTVPAGPVTLAGTATDDVGVASVRVAVKRAADNAWLRPDGTFAPAFGWLDATVEDPGAASTGWSFTFSPTDPGGYGFSVRTDDAAGNTDPTRGWIPFSVASGQTDPVPPDATVAFPAPNQTVPAGPVTLAGTATDDVGVASVLIAVRDNASNRWLRPNGSWGTFAWLGATLASPGAAGTEWQRTVTLSPGSYGLQVRTDDGAGNTDPSRPWVPFSTQ